MKLLINYSIIEYIILILLVIFIISLIYYILPLINIKKQIKKEEMKKIKLKKNLRLIMIQKEINEEMEKELNIH
jgi:predicted Holliday junction resolvase-like endonuclease